MEWIHQPVATAGCTYIHVPYVCQILLELLKNPQAQDELFILIKPFDLALPVWWLQLGADILVARFPGS